MKRKGDRYSIHTSLIVASVKRLLPVGLRACFPNEQNLIMLGKSGFTQVGWKTRPNLLLCVCRFDSNCFIVSVSLQSFQVMLPQKILYF